MRPLLTKHDAAAIKQQITDIRMRQKQREAERVAREAAERATYPGTCYDCRDTGLIVGAINTPCDLCARGRAIAAQRLMAASRMIFAEAHIPPRCRDFTLDSYPSQQSSAFTRIGDFLDEWDGQENLILKGPYGTGKTGLLVGIVRVLCDRYALSGRRIHFTTGADLLDDLRHGYDDGTHAQTLARAKSIALLAIDDLGAEKPNEWVLERLFVIVNARYEAMLPTFITTNYGLDELKNERVGPRVLERLLEHCRVIDVDGENLRRRRK